MISQIQRINGGTQIRIEFIKMNESIFLYSSFVGYLFQITCIDIDRHLKNWETWQTLKKLRDLNSL